MRRTGQWLRLIGLLIEAIGVVGVIRERGGQPAMTIHLPGGVVVSAAWTAVALGFFAFVVGRILIAAGGASRRVRDRTGHDPEFDVSQALGEDGTMDPSPDHGAPDERPEDHVG